MILEILHINDMYHKKTAKSCGIISRIRNILDIKSKKLIYDSLIHQYLTYCCPCLVVYLSHQFKNPIWSPQKIGAYTSYCPFNQNSGS